MVSKIARRNKIKTRIRGKISGTAQRPRMSVFRSNKGIYVQLIDDLEGRTLVAASSKGLEGGTKIEIAARVGAEVAKRLWKAVSLRSCSTVTATFSTAELNHWPMEHVRPVLNFNRKSWQRETIE